MTVFTDVGGVNVGCAFTCGINTVMARRTVTADIGVIKGSIGPRVRSVAIFTGVAGGKVVGRLTFCQCTVVAGATGS